jgi:hypothetical protein
MIPSVLALPVSVEQIAAAVKQMNRLDQQRLLELAPELRALASLPSTRTEEQIQESVQQLQAEVMSIIDDQPIAPDSPFVGNMTLDQYHALPDLEKAHLWDALAGCDLMDLDEQEVAPDALPA